MTPEVVGLEISGLFSSLDHNIPLHKDGITLIHGPNGCGKTTVLRLLTAVVNGEFGYLKRVQFDSFEINLSDGRKIIISQNQLPTKLPGGNKQNVLALGGGGIDKTKVGYELASDSNHVDEMSRYKMVLGVKLVSKSGKTTQNKEFTNDVAPNLYAKLRERPTLVQEALPNLRRIAPRVWRDRESGVTYELSDIAELFGDEFEVDIPSWFSEIVKDIKIGFINAQRLLEITGGSSGSYSEEKGSQVRDFVEVYSQDIRHRIDEALRASALVSQSAERTFPQRILQREYEKVREPELRAKYASLQQRFSQLAETGLQEEIASIDLPKKKLNPTELRVLSLYFGDLDEKLDVFQDLQRKIDTFRTILSKKYRRKKFNIDRKRGFLISAEGSDEPLSPSSLSSGEQHQIVMFYDLIFSKADNLLFLIDEPEISLHVEWQRQFLDDLALVAELKGHKFIIATHSPQIIGGRRELAVALDGGV